MTTEQHADDALRALVREPVDLSEDGLRLVLAAIPNTPQQQPLLTQLHGRAFGPVLSIASLTVVVAIVALVGSALLAGVRPQGVTDAPGATDTGVVLPGVDLVTEEVEPGVFRILGDGTEADLQTKLFRVFVSDPKDAVWVQGPAVRRRDSSPDTVNLGRLGDTGSAAAREGMEVAPDGTIWWAGYGSVGEPKVYHLGGASGLEVIEQALPPMPQYRTRSRSDLEITPDGRVWVAVPRDPDEPMVAVLEEGEWTVLPSYRKAWGRSEEHDCCDLEVEPDGTVWLGDGDKLLRYRDGTWGSIKDRSMQPGLELSVGLDGTLWIKGGPEHRTLARHDQDGWNVWDVIGWDGAAAYGASIDAGPDGTVWLYFVHHVGMATERLVEKGIMSAPPEGAPVCDAPDGVSPGVLSFDGERWQQYLPGHCVTDLAAAADGSVWVTSGADTEGTGAGLYVITPEATAVG